MDKYKIGRVVSVSGEKLLISLFPLSSDESSGVSESMQVVVNTSAGPKNILIGQPGSFVTIQIPGSELLCLVAGIDMKESLPSSAEQ